MNTQKNIAILSHIASGNGKGAAIALKVKSMLDHWHIENKLFQNEWPDEIKNFTNVWVAGGDGTVFQFINKYPGLEIPVAFLGGGTGNDLKNHLYGDLPVEQHVDKLLQGGHFEMDLGWCNGQLYANSLGIGFDGEVLKNMGAIRWIGGHLGYLLAVIKSIFSFKEIQFEINVNGTTKIIHPVILAISNSRLTGGGFIIAPKSSLQDGLLDLLYTEPLPWWKRLMVLPSVEKGKHLKYTYVHHQYITEITIAAHQEVMYQIDGELKSASHFSIYMAEKKLLVSNYPES